jgi:methylenetetrahydrofolate reductase (NADPH)
MSTTLPRLWEAAMALLNFRKRDDSHTSGTGPVNAQVEAFLKGYSIEVMPRTAEKVEDFRALLPEGTRVYIAHIEGTPIEDMVATARRLARDGYPVMPHFPARIIKDRATLADWIARYKGEAGVDQALLLGGGVSTPAGDFDSSMQLMETGLFDAKPIIAWADRLRAEGIDLPIHIGIAGPAKLQTLIKFAIACGVGPSLKVLQKRAMDVSKLLLPYEPTDVLVELAAHKAANPDFNIEHVHFFPLGGIATNANWAIQHGGRSGVPAAQTQG